jgi:hypothetical protein
MSRFMDGPAAGATLCLRRAPYFLRVVIDADGPIDALDLLDDATRPGETPYCYRLTDQPTHAIYCSRGKGCRAEAIGTYLLHDPQPPEHTMRDNTAWQTWTKGEYERLHPKPPQGTA